eukprot:GHVS01077443.1.p1 GENE.GHVS01077443.1~~GHVS01077443.1.p1  ORF type:complete len:126 (+),score=19.42 GHVS01077443.1:299-676(+)
MFDRLTRRVIASTKTYTAYHRLLVQRLLENRIRRQQQQRRQQTVEGQATEEEEKPFESAICLDNRKTAVAHSSCGEYTFCTTCTRWSLCPYDQTAVVQAQSFGFTVARNSQSEEQLRQNRLSLLV